MILTKENIKSIDLDHLINLHIKENIVDKVLIIVPTNRKLRNLKKEIISLSPNMSVSEINIETLTTLTTKLLKSEVNFGELTDSAFIVLLKQVTDFLEFRYFNAYRDGIPSGTLDRIKNVISEYKKQGISPDLLRKEAKELDKSEKLKALDIADIYDAYREKCFSVGLYEVGDIYSELLKIGKQKFEILFRKLFPELETIIINGFDEFSNLELELVNNTAELSNIKTFIDFDYYSYNPWIFSHLDRCYEKLSKRGFRLIQDLSPAGADEFRNLIRENLFLNKFDKPTQKFQKELFLISAADRNQEIELVSKEIKKLITEQNVLPHKICVAFNLISGYSSKVRDQFNVNGIPVNLTDRLSLDQSPPVSAIINFLEILESDFYYKSIFRGLSSGFISLKNIDLQNLIKTASELKIVIGKNNWINSIDDAIKRLKYSDEFERTIDEKTKAYKKAASDINEIYKLISPFDKKLNAEEFRNELELLISKLDIPGNLLNKNDLRAEENIKAVSTFLETVDEVFRIFSIDHSPDEEFDFHMLFDFIKSASTRARFNIKERSDLGVLVTKVNEIRGLSFDYLFICGLVDGDFPTHYNPEIFFSGSFAKHEMIHQTEERYHLYQSLCSWKKRLYLSTPMSESKKELVQSNFIKDLSNLFEFTFITENDYKSTLFSIDEVLQQSPNIDPDSIEHLISETGKIDLSIKELNDAIIIDEIRSEQNDRQTIFNGYLLGENPLIDSMAELNSELILRLQGFKEKQYSISQLETYTKCPFKYFAERLLNLSEIEEPTEEVKAIELGSVLHRILFRFYTFVQENDIDLTSLNDEQYKKIERKLFQIGEEEIENASMNSPAAFYEREKILGIEGNRENSILYQFIQEAVSDTSGFRPQFFEVAFGGINLNDKDKLLSTAEPVKIGEVEIRGKIDRIDINETYKTFEVVDYKLSGNKPSKNDLYDGIALQLPIYMKAGKDLLNKYFDSEYKPEGMYIYSLKFSKNGFGKNEVSIAKKSDDKIIKNKEIIESASEKVITCVDSISKGIFPLTSLADAENKICRFCEFSGICRIAEKSI
ncbi:MAG: exodeoxyribonuclease V subunit gamma [Melioribacteraceae bacterium]|nr:exodeoxyribonuclease V subunit gamma [Melioribacteraceae bacterium]MCF8354793.1 exodeoxyribonuclease V subunit gamma [Melioribacteraceae bacterium]MCF8393313.1 exodeoxyribonuclease V subunit gamma [Melioribacteraceae bacterium]MCF8419165.1 exodeoxyribonuclease V subunit gamma [Melioribacteraceae bacterium]